MRSMQRGSASAKRWRLSWCHHPYTRTTSLAAALSACFPHQAAEEAEREKKKEEEAQAELDDWKHLFEIDTAGTETEAEMTVT